MADIDVESNASNQHVLKYGKTVKSNGKAASCESCRTRRTKCTRDEGSAGCRSCLKKGLSCVQPTVRYKDRASRSSAQVKNSTEAPASNFSTSATETSLTILSQTSVRALLPDTVDKERVLASLLDTLFCSMTWAPPIMRWKVMQQKFEDAGRRADQLESGLRPLALTLIAFGACITDHKSITGQGSLRLTDADHFATMDTLPCAQNRQRTCHDLMTRAVDSAAEVGIFQKPTVESIATSQLLAELLDFGPFEQTQATRVYFHTGLAMTRSLNERCGKDPSSLQSAHGWHISMVDAWSALNRASYPSIPDYELPDLLHDFGKIEPDQHPPLSMSLLENALQSTTPDESMYFLALIWYRLLNITRRIAFTAVPLLKSPSLSKLQLAFEPFLSNLGAFLDFCDLACHYLDLYPGHLDATANSPSQIRANVATNLEACFLLALQLPLAVEPHLQQLRKTQQNLICTPEDYINYSQAVIDIDGKLQALIFRCARKFAQMLAVIPLSEVILPFSRTTFVSHALVPGLWCERLLDGPLTSSYTEFDKANEAKIFIRAIRAQAWVKSERREQARILQAKLELLDHSTSSMSIGSALIDGCIDPSLL